MPRFSYMARQADGAKVSGVEEGESSRAVISALRNAGLTPVSVSEAKGKGKARAGGATEKRPKARGKAPNLEDVAVFARQLSTLIGAGVGLVNALDDMTDQLEKPRFKQLIEQVASRVVGGLPLSAALREHPKVFPTLFCAMTRAGEESGRLDAILEDLATYLEKQLALRRQIRSAMTYPVVIFLFFCGAVAFLFLWLLPKFESLFASLGADLPVLTRYALGFSSWSRAWSPALLAGAVAGGVGFHFLRRTDGFRLWFDRVKLKVPVIGDLFLKVSLVRFIETLATLQKSGVAILMSLEMSGDTIGNEYIKQEIAHAAREVAQGSFLSAEIAKSEIFPRMMIRMLAVGEETGRVEELLNRTAKYYEEQVDAAVQSLTSLIEPVVIVLMGVVVAFVVVSIYFPIFQMAGAVS